LRSRLIYNVLEKCISADTFISLLK